MDRPIDAQRRRDEDERAAVSVREGRAASAIIQRQLLDWTARHMDEVAAARFDELTAKLLGHPALSQEDADDDDERPQAARLAPGAA